MGQLHYKILILLLLTFSFSTKAEDNRSQIPEAFTKSYFEVTPGIILNSFDASLLQPGFSLMAPVQTPPPALRLVLTGYEFNKYLSARITYMRPVLWVRYSYSDNVDPRNIKTRSLWTNVAGLTLKGTLPIAKRLSVYGECGLGIITRRGITDWETRKLVIPSANYANLLLGAGMQYKVNKTWDLQLVSNYTPKVSSIHQPSTTFMGMGFVHHFTPYSEKQVAESKQSKIKHPLHWLQIGVSSNFAGYNVNKFFANRYFPVFWGGDARVKSGFNINYQRNIFHGPSLFAFDLGVNAGFWQTNYNTALHPDNFFTFSIFPAVRLNFLHSALADCYFLYTLAAPTFISSTRVDNQAVGKYFTFMDNMSLGAFLGKEKDWNAEIKIGHYSNGNLFPDNPGIMIPLTLQVGYALK